MDEKANKILVELLQKASDGIDSAVAFSQAQIPDVVHQLLVWNAVSSALFQVFAIIFIILFAWSSLKAAHKVAHGPLDEFGDAMCVFWITGGGIASLVMFIGFWFNFDWLKIWLAPKLYLLEYAASLIK